MLLGIMILCTFLFELQSIILVALDAITGVHMLYLGKDLIHILSWIEPCDLKRDKHK